MPPRTRVGQGQAFREEPSDRLVRAPWLLMSLGLFLFLLGMILDLDALGTVGVVVAFVGGALFTAVLRRADARARAADNQRAAPHSEG